MAKTKGRSEFRCKGFNVGRVNPYLDDLSAELADSGYTLLSIYAYRFAVVHFDEWLQRQGLGVEDIDEAAIRRFATHRCRCPHGRRRPKSRRYIKRVRMFVEYLASRGVVKRPPLEPTKQTIPYLADYRDWLSRHRGLTEQSILRYEGNARRFVLRLGGDASRYGATGIRQLVTDEARRSSTSTARSFSNSARSFLRYLASGGHCRPGLDQAVPTIPQWRLSSMPRYLSPQDVDRVVASCNLKTPVGVRDRAVLLLLVRLGLRAGDIVALRINDIDWSAGTLRVAGKGRRETRLPIPQDVGDALLDYLRNARAPVALDRVFLRVPAPSRPFKTSACVSNIVCHALRRARIESPPSKGANLLRHSAATSMLRGGATLDAISAVLRHRSPDMTGYYAKVDLAMLQTVAQPWPEGTSC
jgi:integrase/recombinase XerD